MPSLKDIRSRIDTVKNTSQITRAMKMVSAAKLRRAQMQIVNMRPYAKSLLQLIADISVTQRVTHPLMQAPTDVKKVLLVVLTSDRGLCGAFNTNINKFAESYQRENSSRYAIDFLFIGRRGADYFARRKVKAKDVILKLDKDVSYRLASEVAARLMKQYLDGDYDEIKIIYNEFKSALQQNVVSETILPIDSVNQTFDASPEAKMFAKDMIFEPPPEQVIEKLLLKHFSLQVYRTMCESVAAEHGARMTSMEAATNNAKTMVDTLTLTYNKLRQASITTELIEITSGAEALKG